MFLRQIQQDWEHNGGGSGGRIEVLVLDSGVDARIGAGLDGFQYGEEPSQVIGTIGTVWIELHSQNLLWDIWMYIF